MKYSFLLIIAVAFCSCYKPSDYDPQPNNSGLISIVPTLVNAPANGVFLDTIIVEIPVNSDPGKRAVTLMTSAGTFTTSKADTLTVNADNTNPKYPGKRYAVFVLQTTLQPVTVNISATLQKNTNMATLAFVTDSATHIQVDADKIYLSNFEETNITATISAPKSGFGKTSAGQSVSFSAASDSLGKNPKGYFRTVKNLTDTSGIATAVYSCDSTYRGSIYIFAKIPNGKKDSISSKTLIIKR